MPTPSNAPEPEPPRPYTFPTCPDVDEQPPAESQTLLPSESYTLHQDSQSPEAGQSWELRLSPPSYEEGSGDQVHDDTRMDVDSEESASSSAHRIRHDPAEEQGTDAEVESDRDAAESVDTSRRVEASGSGDLGMRLDRDPFARLNRIIREVSEDAQKQSDNDDDLSQASMEVVTSGSRVSRTTTGLTDGAGRTTKDVTSQPSRHPLPVAGEAQEVDSWCGMRGGHRLMEDSGLLGMGSEFARTRVIPLSPSSYLRPGSKFTGTQQSERHRYDVQVEIKHVDLRESLMCGYLRIQGLTEDHPTLTTYFEGEIIGSKYGFITPHPTWGANEKIDLAHWGKFPPFRPFLRPTRKGQTVTMDFSEQEHIFMRWKEHFLVPDHRVRTIRNASFEGFYYICFNQVRGEVKGIYFHAKSERFQQLDLRHVADKGCYGALEFR